MENFPVMQGHLKFIRDLIWFENWTHNFFLEDFITFCILILEKGTLHFYFNNNNNISMIIWQLESAVFNFGFNIHNSAVFRLAVWSIKSQFCNYGMCFVLYLAFHYWFNDLTIEISDISFWFQWNKFDRVHAFCSVLGWVSVAVMAFHATLSRVAISFAVSPFPVSPFTLMTAQAIDANPH